MENETKCGIYKFLVDNFCLQYYLVKPILKLSKKNVYQKFVYMYHYTTCELKQGGTNIFHETKKSVQCVNYSLVKILILRMYITLYLYALHTGTCVRNLFKKYY